MRVILLSILFAVFGLASGCQTKTSQFFADLGNSAFGSGDPLYEARSKVWHEQREKEEQTHKDMMNEIDKRADEYMRRFEEEHAECYAALDEYNEWYNSLSDDRKEFINNELDEKQIRYNMIHGFNRDGSSAYSGSGRSLSDGVSLMYKYKPVWDKVDH